MQKAFLNKYAHAANVNSYFLREMYWFVTDDKSSANDDEQGLFDESVLVPP